MRNIKYSSLMLSHKYINFNSQLSIRFLHIQVVVSDIWTLSRWFVILCTWKTLCHDCEADPWSHLEINSGFKFCITVQNRQYFTRSQGYFNQKHLTYLWYICSIQVWTQPQMFRMSHLLLFWHEKAYFVHLTNLICVVWAGHKEKQPSEWILCGIRNLCRPGPCRCVRRS